MQSAAELRQLAAEVQVVRSGIDTLLDDVMARHRSGVWHSRAADASRLRLHTSHLRSLEANSRHLATAIVQIRQRADLLEATTTGG